MNKVVETICNAKWYVVWSELEEGNLFNLFILTLCISTN